MWNLQSVPIDRRAVGAVWAKRVLLYVVGLLILALGVSVSVRSDLGVSPVSALPLVLSRVLHIELGTMLIAVFSAYVLIQIAILGRRFPPLQLLQVACAVLFGRFVTLTGGWVAFWQPGSYVERLAMVLLSTVLVALGLKLYMLANIVPQAAEGLIQTVADLRGWKIPDVKNGFDIASVAIAALVSLLCTGGIVGLREGTVIAALGVGRVMALLNYVDGGRLERLIYRANEKEGTPS